MQQQHEKAVRRILSLPAIPGEPKPPIPAAIVRMIDHAEKCISHVNQGGFPVSTLAVLVAVAQMYGEGAKTKPEEKKEAPSVEPAPAPAPALEAPASTPPKDPEAYKRWLNEQRKGK
jgi:hypothetical protein